MFDLFGKAKSEHFVSLNTARLPTSALSPLADIRLGMSRQSGTPQAVLLAPLGHLGDILI